MSLILDALRKMEQERKVLRAGLNIRPEVLNRRNNASRPVGFRLPLVAGGVVVLIAVGIGAGVFLKGNTENSHQTAVAVRSEAIPEPAPAPAQASGAIQAPAPVQAPAAAPPTAAQPLPAAIALKPAQAANTSPKRQPVEERVTSIPVEGTESGIVISGIAWQDERSLRRAVVNGTLVGEGAEVSGARVVSIGENRVRFSRGGHTFDVSYTSGFPSH